MRSLVKNIVEFVAVLRLAGVRTSIAETIDAVCALEHVDLLSKEQVCIALSACLAKSEEERRIFSDAFEKFFITSSQRSQWIQEKRDFVEQRKAEVFEQVDELKFQDESIDLSNDLKEVYAGLCKEEKQGILDFLEKTSSGKNVKQSFKPIVENLVKGKLDKLKQDNASEISEYQGILSEAMSEEAMIAGSVVESVRKEKNLLYKNLGEISDEDVPVVINLIRQITGKIKRDKSRKYKNRGKKTRLDMKKTLRRNLSTGGALFKLEYKSRIRKKERYLILCDVSASMYRFSGFVLQFISGMQSGRAQTDSYIFSEQVERINIQCIKDPESFEKRVKESTVWRKGTNISKVLEELLEDRGRILKASTVMIIVSDAKTLEVEKTVQNLCKAHDIVKKILWLNPVPQKDWERIIGIHKFGGYCTMMDCSTLKKLEASISDR